jgi:hypothetical protein
VPSRAEKHLEFEILQALLNSGFCSNINAIILDQKINMYILVAKS